MKIIEDIHTAHCFMMLRYADILRASDLDEREHWIKFCDLGRQLTNTDKLSRWVGFIQGLLYASKLITIEEERAYSRNIYKPLYEELGYDTTTREVV